MCATPCTPGSGIPVILRHLIKMSTLLYSSFTERNVTIENVIQIVEAADKSNVHDMKNYALDLIVRNFPRVAHQPQMKNLSRPLLLDILYALAK